MIITVLKLFQLQKCMFKTSCLVIIVLMLLRTVLAWSKLKLRILRSREEYGLCRSRQALSNEYFSFSSIFVVLFSHFHFRMPKDPSFQGACDRCDRLQHSRCLHLRRRLIRLDHFIFSVHVLFSTSRRTHRRARTVHSSGTKAGAYVTDKVHRVLDKISSSRRAFSSRLSGL